MIFTLPTAIPAAHTSAISPNAWATGLVRAKSKIQSSMNCHPLIAIAWYVLNFDHFALPRESGGQFVAMLNKFGQRFTALVFAVRQDHLRL